MPDSGGAVGWWGPNLFSGDTPCDLLEELVRELERAGVDVTDVCHPDGFALPPDGWDPATVRRLAGQAQVPDAVADWVARYTDAVAAGDAYRARDGLYAAQVGAAVLLGAGIGLPERVRQAALHACVHDPWAAANPARQAVVDRFAAVLAAPPDAPWSEHDQTLAEAWRAADAAGHRIVNQPGSHPDG